MHVITRYTAWFYLVLLNLINASSTFAEEQAVPQPHPLGPDGMQCRGTASGGSFHCFFS